MVSILIDVGQFCPTSNSLFSVQCDLIIEIKMFLLFFTSYKTNSMASGRLYVTLA